MVGRAPRRPPTASSAPPPSGGHRTAWPARAATRTRRPPRWWPAWRWRPRSGVAVRGQAAAARWPLRRGRRSACSRVFLTLSRGGLVALGVALIAAVAPGRPAARRDAGRRAGGAVVGHGRLLRHVRAADGARARHRPRGRHRARRHLDGRLADGRGQADRAASAPGNFPIVLDPLPARARARCVRDDFIVDTPKVAHNTYLQVLAELGIVGLALFLSIIAVLARVRAASARRRRRAAGDTRDGASSRARSSWRWSALLAADFFVSREYGKQLWLLLALCPVMLELAGASCRGGSARRPGTVLEVAREHPRAGAARPEAVVARRPELRLRRRGCRPPRSRSRAP